MDELGRHACLEAKLSGIKIEAEKGAYEVLELAGGGLRDIGRSFAFADIDRIASLLEILHATHLFLCQAKQRSLR